MGVFKDCGCGCDGKKQEKKFLISLMAALLFFLIASPEMFQLTSRFFGRAIAGPTGCATNLGVGLHAVVFLVITWALMNVSPKN
jgi:hypothetical protein